MLFTVDHYFHRSSRKRNPQMPSHMDKKNGTILTLPVHLPISYPNGIFLQMQPEGPKGLDVWRK